MSVSVFQLLLQCEEAQFGSQAKDLLGCPILKTELEWINAFICMQERVKVGSSIQAQAFFEDCSPSLWHKFPHFLYLKLDLSGVHRICQATLDFFEWATTNHPDLRSSCQMAKGSLQVGKKNMERLLAIQKYSLERQKSWVYQAQPTESLADILFNEQLTALQAPDPQEIIEDTFELISKNIEKYIGYFKSVQRECSVVVQLDAKLCALLQTGDQLPLKLSLSSSGHYYLNQVGYPLLTPSEWTK